MKLARPPVLSLMMFLLKATQGQLPCSRAEARAGAGLGSNRRRDETTRIERHQLPKELQRGMRLRQHWGSLLLACLVLTLPRPSDGKLGRAQRVELLDPDAIRFSHSKIYEHFSCGRLSFLKKRLPMLRNMPILVIQCHH